jgi:hypothetical protein
MHLLAAVVAWQNKPMYTGELILKMIYSIPSPANSQWHFGVRSKVMPSFCPIVWSRDSSF